MPAGTGRAAAHRGETVEGAGSGSTKAVPHHGTTHPVDMLTKPKSIDDIRARLVGVGVSVDWEKLRL